MGDTDAQVQNPLSWVQLTIICILALERLLKYALKTIGSFRKSDCSVGLCGITGSAEKDVVKKEISLEERVLQEMELDKS